MHSLPYFRARYNRRIAITEIFQQKFFIVAADLMRWFFEARLYYTDIICKKSPFHKFWLHLDFHIQPEESLST